MPSDENDTQQTIDLESYAEQLPLRSGPLPHILMVDDDPIFLDINQKLWKRYYRDRVVLYTRTQDEDPIGWLRERFARKEQLDVVYLDENMPGHNGMTILRALRHAPDDIFRYVPVVLMTASPQNASGRDVLEAGALRYVHKVSKGRVPSTLLHEAIMAVQELREQKQDEMWFDLTRQIAEQIAQGADVEVVIADAIDFLTIHFGTTACYVRVADGPTLRRFGSGQDVFGAGEELRADAVPFIRALLDPDRATTFRSASLGAPDLGKGPGVTALGHGVVAASLALGRRRLGTFTLYRRPDAQPFRAKDEMFLSHLALQIAVRLGAIRDLKQLRHRQTKLAEFTEAISNATEEEAVARQLVEYLHAEIHGEQGAQSKTTVRLVQKGRRAIPRLHLLGLQPDQDRDLNVDDRDSVYVSVIRSQKSRRISDITAEEQRGAATRLDSRVRAELAAPVCAEGLGLGAVNMEHVRSGYYTAEDEAFANALCRLAGSAILKIRSQRFLGKLLELVNEMSGVDRSATAAEKLLTKAFEILHDFTGYARLLYLVPDKAAPQEPWKVQRVIGEDGKQHSSDEQARWSSHITASWDNTYVKRCTERAGESFFYTEGREDISDDADLGVRTEAELVLLLSSSADSGGASPSGMLALLFLIQGACNMAQQQQLLSDFGKFLGVLLEKGQAFRNLLDELNVSAQAAQIGHALGQLRHKMRNELTTIGNSLNRVEKELRAAGVASSKGLDKAREVLERLENEARNPIHIMKIPVHQGFDVGEIVKVCLAESASLAGERITLVGPDLREVVWTSDSELVMTILLELIRNAVEIIQSVAPRPERAVIRIAVEEQEHGLHVSVQDTGPGVSKSFESKLFQAGMTTKPRGTGFGLYHSRRRARELGGDLVYRLASPPPGAVFTLILPRRPRA